MGSSIKILLYTALKSDEFEQACANAVESCSGIFVGSCIENARLKVLFRRRTKELIEKHILGV